ncbi:MAG TPA: T9SS type A sorting domain-containing protein, partial [Flavisolibacter sp.]|nr:T9SS type A sorting domain-containing protein [Flavisolibacter sp.]
NIPSEISSIAGYYISALDVQNGDPDHVLLIVSNYGVDKVFESTDAGTSWHSINGNIPDMPVRWGIFIPAEFNLGRTHSPLGGVMIATELGVWTTPLLNGSSTVWTQNSTNMGNVRTNMIRMRNSDGLVAVSTFGRGIFSANLITQPLPVTFTSFNGIAELNQNLLSWKVENEINNKGYEVQRKYPEEKEFTGIGFVTNNTAPQKKEYQFADLFVDLGKENAAYRLKQIDIDGTYKYSKIILLSRKIKTGFIEYVSATNNRLFIRVNSGDPQKNITLSLFDNSGKLILRKQIKFLTQELNINNLSKGIYIVNINNSQGNSYVQKIVF